VPPPKPEADAALHAQALAWATQWAQRWFLDDRGRDRLQIGHIDAGWATHVEAYLILRDLAYEQLGVRRRRLLPPPALWLKAHGYDRGLRSALLRWVRVAPARRPAAVAAIVEIPTPSMLEPADLVIGAAGLDGAIAAADPRAANRLLADGHRPHPLVVPWREERRLVRDAGRGLAAAWRELVSLPPDIPFGDRNLAALALRRLAPLARRSMPFLAAEAAAVERFLDSVRPSGLAVASDQHRIGRIAIAAARRHGIRSVVLQHGLPQARIGYLPVVADVVATWSVASQEWFAEAGTPRDSLVVTGNPRVDALAAQPAAMPDAPHLLLALSPAAMSTNEALVRDVVASLDHVPGARLTVKLHPGQGDWSFVDDIVRRASDPGRVTVRRDEPLYGLLASASVVVVHRSSVAVEALVAHRPVIVHRAGTEPTTADLELAELSLVVTETPQQLAAAAQELGQPDAADRYLSDRGAAIDRIAGPLDGQSAARIVDLLRTMIGRNG